MSNTGNARLRSMVERIERLETEKKGLAGDIKDLYAESKSAGFDVKALRTLIRRRAKDPAEVEEADTLLDVYEKALSGWEGLPLSGVS